jgi:hypothetical protein
MSTATVIAAVAICIAVAGLAFAVGWYVGMSHERRWHLRLDRHTDYILALIHLGLLKLLNEGKYEEVREKHAEMTRFRVFQCRLAEKRMSAQQVMELRAGIPHCQDIDKAEEVCGSLEDWEQAMEEAKQHKADPSTDWSKWMGKRAAK